MCSVRGERERLYTQIETGGGQRLALHITELQRQGETERKGGGLLAVPIPISPYFAVALSREEGERR